MDKQAFRVACISDTHHCHDGLEIPPCDILIHAGDILQFTRLHSQALEGLKEFLDWFSQQQARHKILIGGNHDLVMDVKITKSTRGVDLIAKYRNITYLNNSGTTLSLHGKKLKVWGIPETDIGMAFNGLTPDLIAAIPDDVDILVTHSPPTGLSGEGAKLDQVPNGVRSVGNRVLYERVRDIVPTLHVFGHVHEGYGVYRATSPKSKTPNKVCTFVNASIKRGHNDKGLNKPVLLLLSF